jgi:hypothetical protein
LYNFTLVLPKALYAVRPKTFLVGADRLRSS